MTADRGWEILTIDEAVRLLRRLTRPEDEAELVDLARRLGHLGLFLLAGKRWTV